MRIKMKSISIFTLLIITACSRPSEFEKYLDLNADTTSNLKLYYSQINDTSLNSIRIIGKIVNLRDEQVSMLTYTCHGGEFLFECDTTFFYIQPNLWCELINPVINKIAPRDTLIVKTTLKPKDSSFNSVRNIGFRFIEIKKEINNDATLITQHDSLTNIGVFKEVLLKGERF